jgi:hypothetical protein
MPRTISLIVLLGLSGTAHAFDFKGLVLGEPITADQVEARLDECVTVTGAACDKFQQRLHERSKVQCGAGSNGATVCNGLTTVAGFVTQANIVIGADGKLRRVLLSSIRPDNFEAIARELQAKFGAAQAQEGSTVQNAFGAQYGQVVLTWSDSQERRIDFTKYAGTTDKSSLFFSTAQDREVLQQSSSGARGDL